MKTQIWFDASITKAGLGRIGIVFKHSGQVMASTRCLGRFDNSCLLEAIALLDVLRFLSEKTGEIGPVIVLGDCKNVILWANHPNRYRAPRPLKRNIQREIQKLMSPDINLHWIPRATNRADELLRKDQSDVL